MLFNAAASRAPQGGQEPWASGDRSSGYSALRLCYPVGAAMTISAKVLFTIGIIMGLPLAVPASAQPQAARLSSERASGERAAGMPRPTAKPAAVPVKDKLNAWTVGLAGGLLEGAPIRFATEIARVADDGDNLHVLPIVTRGPSENVEALLYLKGVDVAIINADALEQFKSLVPDIEQRVTYILNLFPSELHIFAGPDINSLGDLKGKKVNFNTPGTAAAYSGPLMLDRLKLDVEK